MNSYFSSWKKTEMGTIEIEIAKSPSPYVWKNLHSDVDYIPSNQYIWREMYYKYRKQMEPGFALLEDAEIRREEKEDKLLEEEDLSLIHISEPTRLGMISYAVFCLKKKKKQKNAKNVIIFQSINIKQKKPNK
eukprot:TRINITY_DN5428_c0_g1_i3.p4 TRINITY_DN5428_c0_g1~~TRINITY_DN5428_c0_g1_i3.p4  ORF type:complete len:133 (-),score=34.03 TRINITY_DN5428_c0_g1_i3:13-411(-)